MQSSDVRRGIQRSWEIVSKLALGETYSNPIPLPIDEQFRELALSPEATYMDVYLLGLNRSHYNFLLVDYAYFQFSWQKRDHIRYSYCPNPFLGAMDASLEEFREGRELVRAGAITDDEYLDLLRDAPAQFRVPAFRYENSPEQRRELHHPCSHMHIGHHAEDRWALNRVLTPAAFTLLVLKHYYSSVWQQIGEDAEEPYKNQFEAILSKRLTRN